MQVKEKGNKDQDPDPSKQSNNDIIGSSLINTPFYSSTMRSCTGNNFNRQEILLAIQAPDLIQQFNIHAQRTWNCINPLEGGQAVLHRRQA